MNPPTNRPIAPALTGILSGAVCPPRWYQRAARRIASVLVATVRERRRRRHGEHVYFELPAENGGFDQLEVNR